MCSASDSALGASSVGMIAKWSEIFELSKIRLLPGLIQSFFRTCFEKVPYGATSDSMSIVCRTVAT